MVVGASLRNPLKHWLLALIGAGAALGCAPETRPSRVSSTRIEVTHEEGMAIDAALAAGRQFGNDGHRRCVLWTETLAAGRGKPGLTAYAQEAVTQLCEVDAEAKLERARSALRAADADRDAVPAQTAALDGAGAFLKTQRNRLDRNETAQAVLTDALLVAKRLLAGTSSCEEKQRVAWFLESAERGAQAAALFKGPLRACNGVDEAIVVLRNARAEKRCDDGVLVAAEVWPRAAKAKEEQIALLDEVRACSDAFSMRRNFSFVPPETLADYHALVVQRAIETARSSAVREARERSRENAERCESRCMDMYAEQGGVCTNSCRGDTLCFRNCQALGRSCFSSCR